jgi:hypothetical protein
VVNNYKVQEAMKKPQWVADSPYGQPAEMVYRLLTVPMEYSTFATTAQLSDNQDVTNDINIEYRKLPFRVDIYTSFFDNSQFTTTFTVGLAVISMDTCLRFQWHHLILCFGCTIGKSIPSVPSSTANEFSVTSIESLPCGKPSTRTSGSRRPKSTLSSKR